MHEIERYGGRRIRDNETRTIVVQFDSLTNLDRWLSRMFGTYGTDTFSPSINREQLIVAY